MTCHDCIHDEVCDSYGYPYEPCEYFKDKSRYSESPASIAESKTKYTEVNNDRT